jgi:hypothetical protein
MLSTGQEIGTPYSNVQNRTTSKKYHKSDTRIYVRNDIFRNYPSKYIFRYLIFIFEYLRGVTVVLRGISIHEVAFINDVCPNIQR